MGTFLSRFRKLNSQGESDDHRSPKEYSWDKSRKLNLEDYSFHDLVNEVTGKLPGTVDGQQFTIQNCSNSTLYVFDHMNTVTIDECSECKFVLGPVKESVFIRDCKNCVCVVSSGQFRTRDCSNVDIYLCCPTQPIIEASINMRFNCLQFNYISFSDHLKKARLSPFNNIWNCVHDFTPGDLASSEASGHWNISRRLCYPEVPLNGNRNFESVELDFSWEKSQIPWAMPPLSREVKMWTNQSLEAQPNACLVVLTSGPEDQQNAAMLFYRTLKQLEPDCKLSSSKELFMNSDHPFAKNTFGKSFDSGNIVGLRFYGHQCWELCNKVYEYLSEEKPQLKQHIYLRKCCLKELTTQDDFFSTPAPYVPAFSG
ncbi:protein XRP2-like [Ischnura elegans]|uniref:protein XRP2-like n=1 Tax=Ischnura elegans TaxID=197161 RepID=UPI001ED87B5C|nr:protein XRP2-like [Ischnura elegans]